MALIRLPLVIVIVPPAIVSDDGFPTDIPVPIIPPWFIILDSMPKPKKLLRKNFLPFILILYAL